MEKTIRCSKCQENFEVVGSTENSQATRNVTISVECAECDAINGVAWPDRMRYFVRKAD
jgi:phage FluMu protein Com